MLSGTDKPGSAGTMGDQDKEKLIRELGEISEAIRLKPHDPTLLSKMSIQELNALHAEELKLKAKYEKWKGVKGQLFPVFISKT